MKFSFGLLLVYVTYSSGFSLNGVGKPQKSSSELNTILCLLKLFACPLLAWTRNKGIKLQTMKLLIPS